MQDAVGGVQPAGDQAPEDRDPVQGHGGVSDRDGRWREGQRIGVLEQQAVTPPFRRAPGTAAGQPRLRAERDMLETFWLVDIALLD